MLKIILTIGTLQALAISLNVIRTKIVAVLLGPEGVGVISTIDQIVQSAAYFSALSLPFAAIKFLSRAHSESEASFRMSYASFFKALLLLSVSGTVAAICLALFGNDLLGSEMAKYKGLLILALLGIPAMIVGGFFSNVFAAAQKFRVSSVLAIITNSTTLLGICGGIFVAGIAGLYVGSVIAGVLVTGGTLIYLRHKLNLPFYAAKAGITKELKRNPDIIPFALIMYAATFTYSLSFLVARYAVLKNFGEAQAGLLQGALAIAIAMGMVLNPANGLYLTPMMNRHISKETKFQTATDFQKKLVVIICVAALPAVIFPKLVLTILFSSKFVLASKFVALFVVWQFVAQLAGVNQALMIGLDDLKVYALITCLGFLSLAVFSWLLTPPWGILGVAIGFIISGAVIFLLSALRLRLKHGFTFPWNLAALIGYGLTALLIAGVAAGRYEELDATAIVFKVGFYTLFAGSLFFFLSGEEKVSLFGIWNRVLPRRG